MCSRLSKKAKMDETMTDSQPEWNSEELEEISNRAEANSNGSETISRGTQTTAESTDEAHRYSEMIQKQNEEIIGQYMMKNMKGLCNSNLGTYVITFAKVLGDSYVYTREDVGPNDDIGTYSIYLPVNSGDIIPPLGVLFDQVNTNAKALHACLAWLSTLTAVMVVRCLKTISEEWITKAANAPFIIYKIVDSANNREAIIKVPKGELEHLKWKAYNKEWGSEQWIAQLCKPMACYLQLEDGEWSVNKTTLNLERNRRRVQEDTGLTAEELREGIISPIINLSCYFVKNALLAKETEKGCYQTRLKGLSSYSSQEQAKGLKQQSQLPEYWYFRKR